MTVATLFHVLPGNIPPVVVESLGAALEGVELELQSRLNSAVFQVEAVGKLTLEAGGKRLRPALTLLAAKAAANGELDEISRQRAIKLGACLEMIHMATLIHDDVIDEAATRRGKPTASSVYGNTIAILSGDVLLAKAMQLLAEDGDLAIIRLVSGAVVELAEGEVRELAARGDFEISRSEHFEILRMKTAAFIECCCRVGAMVARATSEQTEALGKYGQHLGMAFQLKDDLLDFRGNSQKTGKPLATDFREGQATLPLIHLRDALTSDEGELVKSKFGNGVTDSEISEFCQWMDLRGSFQETDEVAHSEASAAKLAVDSLGASDYTSLLGAIADFVVARES